jgi:anti-sigma-K factor RskA
LEVLCRLGGSSVYGISPIKKSKHHEETHATQKDFLQKVKRLQAILAEMGNQFEEESFELHASCLPL